MHKGEGGCWRHTRTATASTTVMSVTEVVDGDGGGHHAFSGYHNFLAYAQGYRGLVLHFH
jgi:enoyl reductase-like protein